MLAKLSGSICKTFLHSLRGAAEVKHTSVDLQTQGSKFCIELQEGKSQMSILKSAIMLTLQYSCKQSRFTKENEFATHRIRKALNFYKLYVAAKGFSLAEHVFLMLYKCLLLAMNKNAIKERLSGYWPLSWMQLLSVHY